MKYKVMTKNCLISSWVLLHCPLEAKGGSDIHKQFYF